MAEKQYYRHKLKKLINIPKIVTVHYQELTKGYRCPDETHDFWEIVYTDKHDVTVGLGGDNRVLQQGEAIFIKPDVPHYVACNKDANIFVITFECRSESMKFFENRILKIPSNRQILLQTLMNEAAQTFYIPEFDPALNKLEMLPNPNLGGEQIIKNTLESLLIYLLRNEEERAAQYFYSRYENTSDLLNIILKYLSEHIYGSFSLERLSKELHYGKTHLCTFFVQHTGKTIYRTYLEMKIKEAKRLIRNKNSITEIAYMLEFSSPSHFIDVFKRYANCTPYEYAISIKPKP